jgi:hypothetical protein
MFERTHTRWAPWTLIDGEHKKSARVAALTHVADRLSEGLDLSPPGLCEEIARLARHAFGSKLNLS